MQAMDNVKRLNAVFRHKWRQRAMLSRTHAAAAAKQTLNFLAVGSPITATRVRMGSYLSIQRQFS